MATTARELASGPGWSVEEIVCTSGPSDRRFEEAHGRACIAVVTHGSFQYRTSTGDALLVPGALLLGNAGECFECGHDHAVGDRCLAFHFAPELVEEVAANLAGMRRARFDRPNLPPVAELLPVLAAAEAATGDPDPSRLEEVALDLCGTALSAAAGGDIRSPPPDRASEQRVTAALRMIEDRFDEPLSLADSATAAGMSRFHFLRTFRSVVGVTPHQHLLRMRLRRAAARLRRSGEGIATVAFESGFPDLSTFNRQFRRVFGMAPSGWRAGQVSRPCASKRAL